MTTDTLKAIGEAMYAAWKYDQKPMEIWSAEESNRLEDAVQAACKAHDDYLDWLQGIKKDEHDERVDARKERNENS